ncbi:MAG: UDP-glucose 4-epimerase GalE [Mycoplasmataceae bacterium]|jgi:UDP-glucose 4-epimerase|nr:UDP-glucose 4-epimerase GalE [Mycoplasmataceae bacterium]
MVILITGGAGYIGSVIVESFVDTHKVVVLDNLSTGKEQLINPKATFIKGSILNKKILDKLFAQYKFDLVIHLAAKAVVPESVLKPKLYMNVNVNGTNNILKSMYKYRCNKIIFASSAAVYGKQKQIPITETALKRPCNPYGTSKLKAEQLIINSHFKYCILRFFNAAGASKSLKYGMMKDHPTLLITAVNKTLINGKPPIIFGNKYKTKDGTCVRDYVHVEDLMLACKLCIKYLQTHSSGIFNLGSGKGDSVLEVVKLACEINKKALIYDVKPNRLGDPSTLLASIVLANTILKWRPKYGLKDMIKTDYQFRLKNHLK